MKKTFLLTFDYKGAHPNPAAVVAFELGKHLHIDKASIDIREITDSDKSIILFQEKGETSFKAYGPLS